MRVILGSIYSSKGGFASSIAAPELASFPVRFFCAIIKAMETIRVGISTCPNDTFAFHALLNRKIETPGLNFEFELLDVQELNDRLFAGEFDVAKASFHAALLLADEVGVLPSGSALGFGVGPLLLAAREGETPELNASANQQAKVLCPGEHTTAMLLYKLFHPHAGEVQQVVFSEIMPALRNHQADFGVCIHEGRFTWKEQGLALVEDLGERWETATDTPLPLGGIMARKRLGNSRLQQIQSAVHESVVYANDHREETAATMRKYAQEFNDDVLYCHVDLYVNEFTIDLGKVGKKAIDELHSRSIAAGLLEPSAARLEIVGDL